MKIRIEISSGSVSCIMDKEVYMQLPPQDVFRLIEEIITTNEINDDYAGCYYCDSYFIPEEEEPCRTCWSEPLHPAFTRKKW